MNMRPALMIASVALVFTTAAQCFSRETMPTSKQEVESVVIKLYKQIVLRKPLGIPEGKKFEAIRSYLSRNLIERITVAKECEEDYFRQYPVPDLKKDPNAHILKPPFAWMETGLFSGGNEQADPAWFGLRRTVRQKDGSYEVHVRLKWWGESDKYHRPRGRQYDWIWEVVVFVVRDGNQYVVNDVYYPEIHSDHSEPHYPAVEDVRLSQLLSSGCKDGK